MTAPQRCAVSQRFYLTRAIAARGKTGDDIVQFRAELAAHLQRVTHRRSAGTVGAGRNHRCFEPVTQYLYQGMISNANGAMVVVAVKKNTKREKSTPGRNPNVGIS